MQSTTLWFRRAEIPTPGSFKTMITAFPEILEDARQAIRPHLTRPGYRRAARERSLQPPESLFPQVASPEPSPSGGEARSLLA
jgi:hypothetical protein